jgi:hypothetical protein
MLAATAPTSAFGFNAEGAKGFAKGRRGKALYDLGG